MIAHQHPVNKTDVWLTPPHVLKAMGQFDLDPCACSEPRPWPTAETHYTKEMNGLILPWHGRVWCNPPYGGPKIIGPWMRRMAEHGNGVALIMARTETEVFHETVWEAATAVLFLKGRLYFHRQDGTRAAANAGAPSCLVAYGRANAGILAACDLPGCVVGL